MTREDMFEYQAKEILKDALREVDKVTEEESTDVEKMNDLLWEIKEEVGKKFLEALWEYSDDEVVEEVMEEFKD